ncbi:MAG: multidrug effflux MFS transporter [Acidimicrobiales bacterium]|nr:multidrug effflux MFS transporter [Acidimicrobiales bacterium]
MTDPTPQRALIDPAGREFIAIVASLMATAAISIDLMLPGFDDMRTEFGLAPDSTRPSLLITAFFLGLATGQLVFGPASDRYGRRPMLRAGLVVYAVGAVGAAFTPGLNGIIAWRFVWGVGAAGPRAVAMAMVRDTSEGERMARTISLAMAVFILVPIFAPGIGAGLMSFASWRIAFWVPFGFAAVLALWTLRLPETLSAERRRSLSARDLAEAARAVVSTRQTLAFGAGAMFLYGIMTSYLATSEVVIGDVFGHERIFPLVFGAFAVLLGAGSLANARFVGRIGLLRTVRFFCAYLLVTTAALAAVSLLDAGRPSFWAYCITMALVLPGVALVQPNLNTGAMQPVPHVAGMASALLGFAATAGGAVLGSIVDHNFDGTLRPFAVGSLLLAAIAVALVLGLGRESFRASPARPSLAPATATTG